MEKLGLDVHSLSGLRTGVANVVGGYLAGLNNVAEADVRLYGNTQIKHQSRFELTVVRGRPFWTTFWLGNYFLFHPAPKVMLYGAHSMPWYSPAKNIVVIHDLAFELFPEHFTSKDLRRLRLLTRSAVRRADHLVAVSQSAKDDLLRLYGVPEEKVTVVYLACDHKFFHPSDPDQIKALRAKYSLERPYLLSLGTLQRRKNHALLVRAWSQAVSQGADVDLVLAGGKGWLDQDLEQAIKESPHYHRIHKLGFVENTDLPALYSASAAFALPSLYEGFGIPVLEAMACGVPTITSNNSSLIELFGMASKIVDPTSISQVSSAIISLATDSKERSKISGLGLELAQKFNWTKAGQEIWDLTEKLLNEKR